MQMYYANLDTQLLQNSLNLVFYVFCSETVVPVLGICLVLDALWYEVDRKSSMQGKLLQKETDCHRGWTGSWPYWKGCWHRKRHREKVLPSRNRHMVNHVVCLGLILFSIHWNSQNQDAEYQDTTVEKEQMLSMLLLSPSLLKIYFSSSLNMTLPGLPIHLIFSSVFLYWIYIPPLFFV